MSTHSFDFIAEARSIRDDLDDEHYEWGVRIDDAITGGSTGTEILMMLRWTLAELLKSRIPVPAVQAQRIKAFIAEANKVLS